MSVYSIMQLQSETLANQWWLNCI